MAISRTAGITSWPKRRMQVRASSLVTDPSLPQKPRMPGRVRSNSSRSLAITCFGVPAMIINSSTCFSKGGR